MLHTNHMRVEQDFMQASHPLTTGYKAACMHTHVHPHKWIHLYKNNVQQ